MINNVISLEQWKASHPPALIFLQHNLQLALAWQKLFIRAMYGPYIK
jgi:hypothetical protein